MRILILALLTASTIVWSADKASSTTAKKTRAEIRRETIERVREANASATHYLVPEFFVGQRSSIRTVSFVRRGYDIELTWLGNMDRIYEVHRSTEPLFTPTLSTQIGTAIGNSFTDWSALKLRPVRYYYQVVEP